MVATNSNSAQIKASVPSDQFSEWSHVSSTLYSYILSISLFQTKSSLVWKIYTQKKRLVWNLRLAIAIFFTNQTGIGLENPTQFGCNFSKPQTGFDLEKDAE